MTQPRDECGKFATEHRPIYLRTHAGRKKAGLCNCCKTNKIQKNRFYCDNCKDWIESVRARQQSKVQTLKTKVRKYKEIFDGSNPGNVLQMIQSFKRYKSSSDHYRRKCEIILEAYQGESGASAVFKMQSNSIALSSESSQAQFEADAR